MDGILDNIGINIDRRSIILIYFKFYTNVSCLEGDFIYLVDIFVMDADL